MRFYPSRKNDVKKGPFKYRQFAVPVEAPTFPYNTVTGSDNFRNKPIKVKPLVYPRGQHGYAAKGAPKDGDPFDIKFQRTSYYKSRPWRLCYPQSRNAFGTLIRF